MKTLSEIREALEKRGYEAHVFTRAEAVEFVTAAAKKADNVGWGGSETVKELGLRDAVAALRALGFNEETSSKMVADVLARHTDVESVETVIKLALGSRA